MKKILFILALLLPVSAMAQSGPAGSGVNKWFDSFMYKVDALNGKSTNQTLITPNIQGGTISDLDISAALVKPTSGTVSRTLAQHLSQYANILDYGGVGDGSTDSGSALSAAMGVTNNIVLPHTSSGYNFTSGTFAGGVYPNYDWSTSNTGVYNPVEFIDIGNNRVQGSAIGNPDSCTGNAFSPYTQPCLVDTSYKIIMDPASIWQGPNTTNIGMSIGCLPNHKSSNSSNTSNGYNRNWMACLYTEVDTGTDGQANSSGSGFGSSISTEWVNRTLDIGTNSGIMSEDDVNVYNTAVDGGITRDQFILSSASFTGQTNIIAGYSPWSTNSGWAEAIEVNATPFTSTTKPTSQSSGFGETIYSSSTSNGVTTYTIYPRWTRGYAASGSVDDFVGTANISGESGNLLRGINTDGSNFITIDKYGNLTTNGWVKSTTSGYPTFSAEAANSDDYVATRATSSDSGFFFRGFSETTQTLASIDKSGGYIGTSFNTSGKYCLDLSCTRYVYEADSKVKIGNTTNGDVASIDDSGDMILKGTLTQSGTP